MPMPVGQATAFWKRTPCGPSSITKPGMRSRALSGVVMKPLLVSCASFSSVLIAASSESMRGSRVLFTLSAVARFSADDEHDATPSAVAKARYRRSEEGFFMGERGPRFFNGFY